MTGGGGGGGSGKTLEYDEVFNQSSTTNCTVYAGGCSTGDENALRRAFTPFGRIMEVRYFKDKGYAFVRYDNKESACNAIVALHCTEVGIWGGEVSTDFYRLVARQSSVAGGRREVEVRHRHRSSSSISWATRARYVGQAGGGEGLGLEYSLNGPNLSS